MNNFSAVLIRKSLVVFQFTISIILILGALVITRQLRFLNTRELGFNKDQQLILPLKSPETANNYAALKNEILKYSFIKNVTCGSAYPGMGTILNDILVYAEGKTVQDNVDIQLAVVDNDYVETLGLQILAGRTFSREFTSDSTGIILNETALRQLGYTTHEAIGKKIYYKLGKATPSEMQIVGVVKDFNFESLHEQIKPFALVTGAFGNKYSYVIASVSAGDYTRQLKDIEKSWKTVNPNTPFLYSFLDQDFQRNYDKDIRASKMVTCFTCLSIFIACLGLFGLASFSAERRTREIGIRKVLGATVTNVVMLLSQDFIGLVALAIIVGSPLAWFGLNQWLEAFAYRIPISWWMFALAGAFAVLIALLTVSFQAVRAGIANPVKSLRAE